MRTMLAQAGSEHAEGRRREEEFTTEGNSEDTEDTEGRIRRKGK